MNLYLVEVAAVYVVPVYAPDGNAAKALALKHWPEDAESNEPAVDVELCTRIDKREHLPPAFVGCVAYSAEGKKTCEELLP